MREPNLQPCRKGFTVNKVLSLLIAFTFLASAAPTALPARQASAQDAPTAGLTNRDVMELIKAGLSAEVVVAKIKTSPTSFDTSAAALQELKAGKLEWAMQDVQAADGTRVPSRFTKRALGDSKGGTVAVAAVATTVLLGPVGLLWGLKKGKAAIIPAGNRYSVFVHGDTTVRGKADAHAAQAAQ